MDIQWVIIAQGHKLHTNKTIDIYGICHHFTKVDGLTKAPVELIAKMIITPNESGTRKVIGLTISHREKGIIDKREGIYDLPDLESWMTETPYIYLLLNEIELIYDGEYIFSISVDSEYKNEERLIVR